MRGRAMALLGLICAAALAVGCASEASSERTVVVAEDQAPPIANPLLAEGATVAGQRLASNVLQGLLTVDDRGRHVPQLAVRVPSGRDLQTAPTRVSFELHPEARWSDGRPVTVADVEFTWRLTMDDGVAMASRSGWDRVSTIRAGRRADGSACHVERCFTVAFDGDHAAWRDTFSVAAGRYILPRHVLENADFNTVWNRGGMVGSGPFVLEEYRPHERAVLARDGDFWGGPAPSGGVERIVIGYHSSAGSAVSALDTGAADLLAPSFDPALIGRLEAMEGVRVDAVPSVFFEHLAINTARPPLNDLRVRRALAWAIDRDRLVELLVGGGATVLQSPILPLQPGHRPAFARYEYDPARAVTALEAAGWQRADDGIFARGGTRLEVELAVPAGAEVRRSSARLIRDQAAAAGIAIRVRVESPQRLFGPILGQGRFDLAMFAIGGGTDPSLSALLASDAIPMPANAHAGQNIYRARIPGLDELLSQADATVDPVGRAALLARIQGVVADHVPLVPLYQQPNTVALRGDVEGVRVNPSLAEVYWNSGEWTMPG